MRFRRFAKTLATVALIAAGIAALSIWWAAQAASRVPRFYQEAAKRMPTDVHAASAELQQQVTELQERVKQRGDWEATFTEPQINAWLSTELQREFPAVLPAGVVDPRVVLEADVIRVAARYVSSRFDWVISFNLHVRLTDQPNVLAIEVSELKAGELPLPISNFRKHITNAAAKGDLEVRWSEEQGNPIALVTVPSDHERYVSRPVLIEQISMRPGELYLSGHTGPHALQVFSPRGPIFRIASIVLNATLQ